MPGQSLCTYSTPSNISALEDQERCLEVTVGSIEVQHIPESRIDEKMYLELLSKVRHKMSSIAVPNLLIYATTITLTNNTGFLLLFALHFPLYCK